MLLNNIFDYDVIVLDCDGVIFDSNNLKTEAFRLAPLNIGYPDEVVERFVEYHKKNGGISRYIKFRKFITDFLNEKFDEKLYKYLLDAFSRSCVELYKTVPFTSGFPEFIEKVNSCLYVASGGDEDELRSVFVERGIADIFMKIYGSPKTKSECIKLIKSQCKQSDKIVFIGDAMSDFKAANENNIDFVFMSKYSENRQEILDVLSGTDCLCIQSFEEYLQSK